MFDLKNFRKDFKLKQTDIASLFKIGQSNISEIENFGRSLTEDQKAILIDKFGLESYIKYEIKDTNNINVLEIYSPKSFEKKLEQGSVKLYDIEAAANLTHLVSNTSENIIGEISIPNIPSCDGALYVRGDSMYPLLKSGDIVAYKVVPNEINNIIYGEMYLISMCVAGDEYLTVKYINKSDIADDWIKLVSYNKHHEPKDFPLASIRTMALVKFSIRMNTMS